MPDIDLTDLLSDSDIAGDAVTIVRARRNVNTSGMTVDSQYTIVTYGSLQPASGAQLQTLPEEQRVLAHISVWVPVMLIPLSRSNAPDLVVYNGQRYRVITVQDYSHFGQGYYQGLCQLVDTALTETA